MIPIVILIFAAVGAYAHTNQNPLAPTNPTLTPQVSAIRISPDGHTALIVLCAGVLWLVDIETSVQSSGHMWSSDDASCGGGGGSGGGGKGSGGGSGSGGGGKGSGGGGGGGSGGGSGENSSNKSGNKGGSKSGSKSNIVDGSGGAIATATGSNIVDNDNNSNAKHKKNHDTSRDKKKKGGDREVEEEVKGGEGWYFVTDLGRPLVNADAVYYERQPSNDDDQHQHQQQHHRRHCGASAHSSFAYARCRVYCAHPDGLVSVIDVTFLDDEKATVADALPLFTTQVTPL